MDMCLDRLHCPLRFVMQLAVLGADEQVSSIREVTTSNRF